MLQKCRMPGAQVRGLEMRDQIAGILFRQELSSCAFFKIARAIPSLKGLRPHFPEG